MNNPIINVCNITKSFRLARQYRSIGELAKNLFCFSHEYKKAVDDVSFQIDKGEMVGFIGPNGAGKTTTVKILTGILHPDRGEIKIDGFVPYRQRKAYVRNIGVVFGQKGQISYDLTPLDAYDVLKCIYRIPEKVYRYNLDRFSELLDIKEYIDEPAYQLSLGQRMRAEIVCSLLHSPSILFLDEPTIGIDVVGKEKIRNGLKELNRTDKVTMIFTSHDMQDIETTCDRLVIMDNGKKIYDGSMKDIRKKYSSRRIMEVEFETLPQSIDIKDVTCAEVENNPMSRYLHFDTSRVNYNELIIELMEKYDIRDIAVKEIETETLIRNIYNNSSDKKYIQQGQD